MPYQPQMFYPQNNYQPNYQMPQAQPQQNNNGLVWVSGEVGAKSFLVAPNTSILLMDSEGDRFFIKTTDASGMPTIRTFEYKEINAPQAYQSAQKQLSEQYVTRAEWDELKGIVDGLKSPKNSRKKEVEVDE